MGARATRALASIVVAVVAGCGTAYSAAPEPASDGGGLDGGAMEGATADAAGTDGSAGDSSPDASGDSGPPATSCKALLAADPSLAMKDGFFDIQPDALGGGALLHVFCDMSLGGGGWTLVGRSAFVAAGAPLGWGVDTGSATDLTQPYSFDVVGSRLAFSEVLVGDRTQATTTAQVRAYKLNLSSAMLELHPIDTIPTVNVVTLFGDCIALDGPTAFRNAGASSLRDGFFFRDVADTAQHRGLRASGFDTAYASCAQGASLDGVQGVIFVR